MLIIGKTHMVEFAFGGWDTNQHLGIPWNLWDASVAHIPGGSSSGSGVIVAVRTRAVSTNMGWTRAAVSIFLRCSSY